MDAAISKLEAEILNLQSVEQAIIDQADMVYRKNVEDLAARIAAKGYKGVVMKTQPIERTKEGFNGLIALITPLEYRNDTFISAVVDEAQKLVNEKFKRLISRVQGIKYRIDERMSEIAKFTKIESVRQANGDHFHLFALCGVKVYSVEAHNLGPVYFCISTSAVDFQSVERFKAEGICPMYIARNPSAIVHHKAVMDYAMAEIDKETGKGHK